MTVYLLAHGSADPRHAQDVSALAGRLGTALGEQVRPCYLDLCPPVLAAVADTPGVVVPLLFSPGYHVKVDVGEAVAQASVDLIVAEPPLLTGGAAWGFDLLSATQRDWPGRRVVLVSAGSRDPEVLALWEQTAAALDVSVVHASGPGARLPQLELSGPAVVLPLLAARGHFGDRIAAQAQDMGLPVAAIAGSSPALVAALARCVARARVAA